MDLTFFLLSLRRFHLLSLFRNFFVHASFIKRTTLLSHSHDQEGNGNEVDVMSVISKAQGVKVVKVAYQYMHTCNGTTEVFFSKSLNALQTLHASVYHYVISGGNPYSCLFL